MIPVREPETKFLPPGLTGNYSVCPIPFRVDTYQGCTYGCRYCFARELTDFHRRRKGQPFEHLIMNDVKRFSRWFRDNYDRPYISPRDPVIMALKRRIPIKIGILADPCPKIEWRYRVTEKFLRILHRADYPVHIQTKNPLILSEVLDRIGDKQNLVVSVTLISLDREWCRVVEPGAPSPDERLKGIRAITERGYPVLGRIQPAVYPAILDQLPGLVEALARAGAWGFNTEGLKCRVTMGRRERIKWEKSPLSGVRDYYKQSGIIDGSDYVLSDDRKLEYIIKAQELANIHSLSYFSADNRPLGYGQGPECCGTQKLRDYHPFRYDLRTRAFGLEDPDDPLAGCYLNFTRASSGMANPITIKESIDKMD